MLREFGSGTESLDLECLAGELRGKSANDIFAELECKLLEAERTGIEVDPGILDMYLCILDEKDPVPNDGVSFDQMWRTFKHHHPELITPTPEHRQSNRPRRFMQKRFVIAVFALLALLVGATVAFRMGNAIRDKGETLFSESSGTMLMGEANSDGYRSLAEAMEDYSISENGTLLTWIPVEYALTTVNVIEIEGTTKK